MQAHYEKKVIGALNLIKTTGYSSLILPTVLAELFA